MKTRLAALMALFIGVLSAQLEMNYSYEMKYGDGKQVLVASPNNIFPEGEDYNYLEHIMEINTTFSNGVYLFTQFEYSNPPVLGESIQGINKFYIDYYWDKLYFKVGDIYSLQGRGLSLNLMQDQNIDYDNSVRGLESRYDVFDNFSLYSIIGQSKYKYRSDPAEREKDLLLDSKLNFAGFEYDHGIIGTMSFSLLLNDIYSNNENNMTDYKLTEYDFTWGKQIKNIDLFIDYLVSKTNGNQTTNGEKLYAMLYTNIYDYSITYEFKKYLLNNNEQIISANAPIVFKESNSPLISSNSHAINWHDETGHQIEINKSFSTKFIVQSNLSFSHNHSRKNISLLDLLKMDDESEIYTRYPFRQFYLEASGWIYSDNIYYKIGLDQFDDFKIKGSNSESVSAFTIPSMFSINISDINSVTIYAEYQNRDEITRNQGYAIQKINNFVDHYFSLTYNYRNLLSLTYFYRDEVFTGKWGEIMGGGYQYNTVNGDLDGSLSDGNLDKWRAVEISYKYNTTTQISVLYGSQKGGLVCANGICAVQPGFDDGYKITFRSLF